jgi:cell division control protein 6
MSKRILEEELRRRTVFRDPGILLPDYVPPSLVHRDEEFRWLAKVFRQFLSTRVSQHVLVVGEVGVGKTVLTYKFGSELQGLAREREMQLDFVHINCRKDKSTYAICAKLVHHFNPRWPYHGLGPEKLLDMVFTHLEAHNKYLLLALDEIDHFTRLNGPDLIYALTRSAEERGRRSRVGLIGIAREKRFLDLLDPPTRSTFMHNVLTLVPYNATQLIDIMTQRIEGAFKPGAVDPETVELVADIAARWGNARLALELLWRAGLFADSRGSDVVLPEHAREAKAEVYPEIRREVLESLQLHEKLVLLALARRLKISRQAYALTGEVRKGYEVVCEEWSEEPRGATQFWNYMNRLQSFGLVDLKPSGVGHRGKSTRVSIPDVPVAWLEKEILATLERSH